MRYSIISFCLLLAACGSYPGKRHYKPVETVEKTVINPYFSQEALDYVYKARITSGSHNFGGLFIVKKLGKEHHRVAFTTELGNKIFDISLDKNGHHVHHILDKLDKKPVINLLARDFKVLVEENPTVSATYTDGFLTISEALTGNRKHYYHTGEGLGFPEKIVRAKHAKEKVVFLFSDISDNIAGKIRITHNDIKLNIDLRVIR